MTFSTSFIKKPFLLLGICLFFSVNGYGQSFNIPFNSFITINDPSGELYDSGGPNQPYLNGQNAGITIDVPGECCIAVSFQDFNYENQFDYLTIYDGPDINSPLIGAYTNTDLEGITIISSGSSITLVESTDQFFSTSGFNAIFTNDLTITNGAFSTNINTDCSGVVEFMDESIGFITDWLWDFGDGNTSNLQNPIHQYTESGIYEANLMISNVVDTVFLFQSFEVFLLNEEQIIPEFDLLSNQVNFSLENTESWWTIHWDFGDGDSSNLADPTHLYEQTEDTSIYQVTLTVSAPNDDCMVIIEEEIVILPLPKTTLKLQVETNLEDIEVNDGMHVFGSFNNWNIEDKIPMIEIAPDIYEAIVDVQQDSTHLYRFINGTVEETIEDDCGIPDGFGGLARSIEISQQDSLEVSSVCFSYCQTCIINGIDEIASIDFTIAPNPNNGLVLLELSLDQTEDVTINILNTLGQNIYNKELFNVINHHENIDLRDYSDGLYFIQLIHQGKQVIQPIFLNK